MVAHKKDYQKKAAVSSQTLRSGLTIRRALKAFGISQIKGYTRPLPPRSSNLAVSGFMSA